MVQLQTEMAERKLNINAPLMSVRRSSAMPPSLVEAKKKILEKRHTLPCHKSDLNLDQVTEPVTVPFNWEHSPGRRKGNGGSETRPCKEGSSVTPSPRLSPGKSTNSTKQPLEKEWKTANKFNPSNKSNSFNHNVIRLDCEKEKEDERSGLNVDTAADVDDNDVFSDAFDRLSHTESFSMNCSLSGVSGLDNFDAKKSGKFSTDQQTRDFMMSRFLPAAKAMTLQTPQYASRKQSVAVEQPREVNKLVLKEKKPSLLKHVTDNIPDFGQADEEEESEDEGDDYDASANISPKGCGLFTRFRMMNSLCLLNPEPGMRMKNQLPMPSSYEAGKSKKGTSIRSFSPAPAVKKAWDAIHKSKSGPGAASPDMQDVRKKWASESNRFTYSGELQPPGRSSSPFRRSRAAAGISPCRSRAPQSPFRGARLLVDSREADNNHSGKLNFHRIGHESIQELLSQEAKKSSNLVSSTIEKTLYIDTASTANLSSSNSGSIDTRKRIDIVVEKLERRRTEYNINTESSRDTKRMDSEALSSSDAKALTLSSMLHLRAREDKAEGLVTDQKTNQEAASAQNVQGIAEIKSDINNQQIVVADASVNASADSDASPLAPPLPKSPSESWLWQTLPLVPLRNSFSRSNPGTQVLAKRQDSNTTSTNAKWETIVKTSNLHHDHVRYSQELKSHVSQYSNS